MVANFSSFLLPFFISLLIALVLLTAIILLAGKGIDTRNSARHIHDKNISRFGGVAIIIAFMLGLVSDERLFIGPSLKLIMVSSLAILIFGLVDDLKQLNWKTQLVFQIVLVLALGFSGIRLEYITNPFGGMYFFDGSFAFLLGLLISAVWMIFLMNAMNWLDGVDGVSGIVTIIASAAIFFLSLKPEVNQPPIAIMTAALTGALVAFLFYNFNPAKIMAGTSGSMFMGFILAVLAIFAGAKIATTLMVLAIPIVDALWVLGERIYQKKSIFEADQRHLHYRLLKLGWSVKRIFLFYFLTTSIIAILALKMRAFGKLTTMLVFAFILVSILFYLSKKICLENEKNS